MNEAIAQTRKQPVIAENRARSAVAAILTEKLSEHARDVYGFDGERCDRITARVMHDVLGP